jgi:hypothetical protein
VRRERLRSIESRALPHGRRDALAQLLLFAGAYVGYELVRGLVAITGGRPFADARAVIRMERRLGVFVEPEVQRWVELHAHWLLLICDWGYLNAQFTVTVSVLVLLYLRHRPLYRRTRDTFLIAMAVALAGYAILPTAPPRLMPGFGFEDSIAQFTGISIEHGAASLLFNPYAAIPSMHVAFAAMIARPMAQRARGLLRRALWIAYPPAVALVVIVTANHYLTDVALGGLTALAAWLIAGLMPALARLRRSGVAQSPPAQAAPSQSAA